MLHSKLVMVASTDTETNKRKLDYVSKSKSGHDTKNNQDKVSSANKKRALMHERQSHRRHYEEVKQAKEIWNKLRKKDNDKKEVDAMVAELMVLFEGKFQEVVLKHDASRVVQSLIQFGSPDQRKLILNELRDIIPEMSKIQYAHFVVLKLIKYSLRDETNRRTFVKSLKGHIPKLAVHAVGARVVELVFATLPSKSIALLKQEMYGPKFALFATGDLSTSSLSLKQIVEQQPENGASAIQYLRGVLNKGIEKSLFGFAFFQELSWEYFENCPTKELQEMISSVVDHSIHMLSTRAGSKVIAYCAAYGTPKDRRKIMRNLKGYTKSSLLHKDAYIAIIRLLDVTDDTVAIQKNILIELLSHPVKKGQEAMETDLSPILDIALSDTGSKLFLHLLASDEEQLFDPFERELLKPATITGDGGEVVSTSKKNPETRRKELAQYLRKILCDLCLAHTTQLMRSKSGSKVIRVVFQSFPSVELATSIVDACAEPAPSDKDLPLFENPVAHLMIKRVLQVEAKEGGEEGEHCSFASILYQKYKGKLMEIASSNRGAFILTDMVKVKRVSSEVRAELQNRQHLKTLKEKKKEKGFEALLKELDTKSS